MAGNGGGVPGRWAPSLLFQNLGKRRESSEVCWAGARVMAGKRRTSSRRKGFQLSGFRQLVARGDLRKCAFLNSVSSFRFDEDG